MSRYAELERLLDNDNLSDADFDKYNKELNVLQAERNRLKELQRVLRIEREKEEREQIELNKILSLTEEQVEKMYEDSCLKYQDVNGLSFKEWYEQSLKYYTIDSANNVHAKARSKETVEVIAHPSLAQAKLTILNRIRYKFYDHAVRGRDFAYEM